MYTKRKNYGKGFYRKPARDAHLFEVPHDANRPSDEASSAASQILAAKTVKGLPKSGSSVTVKQDPYATVLPGSDPYALINNFNPKAGGSYQGKDNLDGGQTQQLLTSTKSNFLHCFDSMLIRGKANYRYLPIRSDDTARGKGFVREMLQACDEMLSLCKATTFTNLALYDSYYIATDRKSVV